MSVLGMKPFGTTRNRNMVPANTASDSSRVARLWRIAAPSVRSYRASPSTQTRSMPS